MLIGLQRALACVVLPTVFAMDGDPCFTPQLTGEKHGPYSSIAAQRQHPGAVLERAREPKEERLLQHEEEKCLQHVQVEPAGFSYIASDFRNTDARLLR
jgi:hypothetical protein